MQKVASLADLPVDRGLRVEAVDDFFGEGLVGVHVFVGEHDDARGEAVAEGVHAGPGFAFPSAAGGGLGVSGRLVIYGLEAVGCVFSG